MSQKQSDRDSVIAKIESWKRLAKTEDGKRVIRDLCEFSGMFTITDPVNTHDCINFMEGRRSMMAYIIQQIGCDYDAIQKMYEDQQQEFNNQVENRYRASF